MNTKQRAESGGLAKCLERKHSRTGLNMLTKEELSEAAAWIDDDPCAREVIRAFAACERSLILTYRSEGLTAQANETRRTARDLRDRGRLRRLLR